MKKISLSLVVLSLTISPAITMLSCSSSISVEDLRISITKEKVIQADIDNAIVDFNATSEISKKVEILNQLFTNITIDNFSNFDIKIDALNPNFILTAKSGFSFGTQPSIISRTVFLDLLIKVVPTTQAIISKTIKDYSLATTDVQKIDVLNSLFLGITNLNFVHFKVSLGESDITLIASEGYIFNSSLELKSIVSSVFRIGNN